MRTTRTELSGLSNLSPHLWFIKSKAMEMNINNADLIKVKTEWFKFSIDVVYGIQVKRIALGYSQEDLSFLLSKPLNYIYSIEHFLPKKEYYALDIFRLAEIFSCEPKDLFPVKSMQSSRITIGVYQYSDKYHIKYYEAYSFQENEIILLYELSEHIQRSHGLKSIRVFLKELIDDLLHSTFFNEGEEAWYIFKYCTTMLKVPFRPKYLIEVLRTFTQEEKPKLKMIKDDGRVLFIKLDDSQTQSTQPKIKL